MIDKRIGIIGCGNMGEAILGGLVSVMEKSTSIMVGEADASRRDHVHAKYRMIVEIDNNRVVKFSDVVILAVKPKDVEALLKEEVCCGMSEKKLLISIAAGITTKYIEGIVGREIPVIRAMPNIAAMVGQAVTSISPGASANDLHMKLAREIFSLIGDVVEIGEDLADAVTALSGTGPAYFYYLIEALEEGARRLGLDEEVSKTLARKTAIGSARLLEALGEEPAALRGRVTSKGGTTEAAIKALDSKKFKAIIAQAMDKAMRRSKELSRG